MFLRELNVPSDYLVDYLRIRYAYEKKYDENIEQILKTARAYLTFLGFKKTEIDKILAPMLDREIGSSLIQITEALEAMNRFLFPILMTFAQDRNSKPFFERIIQGFKDKQHEIFLRKLSNGYLTIVREFFENSFVNPFELYKIDGALSEESKNLLARYFFLIISGDTDFFNPEKLARQLYRRYRGLDEIFLYIYKSLDVATQNPILLQTGEIKES